MTPKRPSRNSSVVGNPWVARLAVVGYTSIALVYATIGVLGVESVLGIRGDTRDSAGALKAVAHAPLGVIALPLLGLGLAAYCVWRLLEAFFLKRNESPVMALIQRIGGAASGIGYGFLAYSAFRISAGYRVHSSDGATRSAAKQLLALPYGRAVVVGVAIGFGIAAVSAFIRALQASFQKKMDLSKLSAVKRSACIQVSRVGLLARGVFFAAVGVFLVFAAMDNDAREARGINGAFTTLSRTSYGFGVALVLAAGLWAYAGHMLVMARYGTHGKAPPAH